MAIFELSDPSLDSRNGQSRIMEGCLQLSGGLFLAPFLHNEIFDNESLFDFVHEWLASHRVDPTGRFTIIITLDEYVLVFILLL
jgi:hypothetical protein